MDWKKMERLPSWMWRVHKGVLVAIVLAAFFLPVAFVAFPFVEFFNDMAAQPMARSQMTYGRTHGQRILTERSPVPGTVPRNAPPTYPFSGAAGKPEQAPAGKKVDKAALQLKAAKKVGARLKNPHRPTVKNMTRGKERFDVFCTPCHGAAGEGDGPATGQDRFPAPPSLHTKDARAYKDGTVFHIITTGLGMMPGYSNQLEPSERWDVISYIRALQRAKNPKPEDLKP